MPDLKIDDFLHFSSFLVNISLHAKIQDPRLSPSGRKVNTWKKKEERERREKTLLIVAIALGDARCTYYTKLDYKEYWVLLI